jgi:hypothetical protein
VLNCLLNNGKGLKMLIKAKDLQVGDVIAEFSVTVCDIGFLFSKIELRTSEYITTAALPLNMELEVTRPEYVRVDIDLIKRLLSTGVHCTCVNELRNLL